jgi:hypothetical protein
VDTHTNNLNNTAGKVEQLRQSFDAMHNSRGSTQQERDAEWAGAMDRLKKEGPGWLDAHRENLNSLKYGYDVLKPAIEANLRAAGVPDNQLQARVAAELTSLNDPIVNNRDAARGQYWVREHRDAINQDTRRLPDVMQHVNTYANAIGATEAERAALREKFRGTGNGISDEQNAQYRNNGQGPINDLGRLASAAQQYRNTFNAQYEAAGLNPQQIQQEWERQKKDPNTVAGKLAAGNTDLNQLRSETTQLAAQQPTLLRAGYDNTRLAEQNAELQRQLAARPVTPAGAPTAGGTTFTMEQGGRQVPVNVTMDAGKRIAKDAEGRLLAAGTVVTASIPMSGSTTPMSLRFEVKENGVMVAAPNAGPVATAAPTGPTR